MSRFLRRFKNVAKKLEEVLFSDTFKMPQIVNPIVTFLKTSLNTFSNIIYENVILFGDVLKNVTKSFWTPLKSHIW